MIQTTVINTAFDNTVRGFRPRNTLYTLNTTLHVSTLLGSFSGVLFSHYFRHCNVVFICVLCCDSRSWSWDIVRYGLFVTRIQNTLLVLALDLVVYTLSYFGRISLVGSLHFTDVFLMLMFTVLSIYATGCKNEYKNTNCFRYHVKGI
jgi:hypothetical protein